MNSMNTVATNGVPTAQVIRSPVPVTQQMAQQLRALIQSGKFDSGSPLPSHRVLAAQFGIPVSTANLAIRSLVAEGLLIRRHGLGTFIKKRPHALRTVAIYYQGNPLALPEARYLRALHACLLKRLAAEGMCGETWNDVRPLGETHKPWLELAEACRCGAVDAIMAPSLFAPGEHTWLNRLSVPMSFVGPKPGNNRVAWAEGQLMQLACEALAHQGCHSVGLIMPWPTRSKDNTSTSETYGLWDEFLPEVRRLGLATSDAWVVTPDKMPVTSAPSAEEWGYRAFMRIWRESEHPDGLIAISDVEALGVTMALMELGVRVPESLKLVYFKNAEINLFCPFAVTYVVNRADDVAVALLDMVRRQFAGERVEPVFVGYTAEESSGQLNGLSGEADKGAEEKMQ